MICLRLFLASKVQSELLKNLEKFVASLSVSVCCAGTWMGPGPVNYCEFSGRIFRKSTVFSNSRIHWLAPDLHISPCLLMFKLHTQGSVIVLTRMREGRSGSGVVIPGKGTGFVFHTIHTSSGTQRTFSQIDTAVSFCGNIRGKGRK